MRSASLLIAIVLGLICTGLWTAGTAPLTTDAPSFVNENYDHYQYYRAATGAYCFSPMCHRPLIPFLAGRVLPFGVETNFRLLTFLGLWFTGVAMFLLCRAFGFDARWSMAGVLAFYSLPWAAGFTSMDFWVVDAWLFALVTLCLVAIRRGDVRAMFALLVVGMLVKETMVVIVPVAWHYMGRKVGLRAIIVCGFMYLGIRLLIHQDNDYSILYAFVASIVYRLRDPAWIWAATFGTFHGLLALALLGWRRNRYLRAAFGGFVGLVYAQLLVAGDTERLIVTAFPAVILMALATARERIEEWRDARQAA